MPKKELIALFATVRTELPRKDVVRNDPEQRFNEIVDATLNWLQFTSSTQKEVILLENSDYAGDLEMEFSRISNYRLRVVSVPKSKKSKIQGISIGELEMMRHLGRVVDLQSYDFLWKAPGRNFVLNNKKILSWDERSDMVFARNWRPHHLLNTRIFGMRPELWQELVSSEISFTKDIHSVSSKVFHSMEHLMTKFVLDQEIMGRTQVDFSEIPKFSGYSGSTGKIIDSRKRRFLLRFVNPIRPILVKLLLGNTP